MNISIKRQESQNWRQGFELDGIAKKRLYALVIYEFIYVTMVAVLADKMA